MISNNMAMNILKRRQLVEKEPKEFALKREKWLSYLRVHFSYEDFKVCEMYNFDGEVIKTELYFEQFRNKYINTRRKLDSETVFEIDKLPQDQTVKIISEICLALIRNYIHFAVFCAENSRSPHIRIYDFEELRELDDFHHEQAQLEFWKSISPALWKFADRSVWSRGHLLQLEFALHFKHGTPFNLVFEWIPTFEKQEILFGIKEQKKVLVPRKRKEIQPICEIHGTKMYKTIEQKWLCAKCSLEEKNAKIKCVNN